MEDKPARKNLFDDESGEDEDFDPSKNAAAHEPVAAQAPVAQAQQVQEEKQIEDEEEYVPQQVEQHEAPAQTTYAPPEEEPAHGGSDTELKREEEAPAQIVSTPVTAPKPVPAKHVEPAAPTEAELKLKQDAENAKKKLMEEIKQFKVSDDNNSEDEPDDPRVQKFVVTNPVKVGGNVKYTVEGVDDEGDFSEVRRFREFFALAQVLRTRWVGCYVPSIPEKNIDIRKQNDEKFIEERRSLLERFLRECAKYDYIIYSKEFKVFARQKGEIDKVLSSLPKQTPLQVLEKYRLNFQINEEQDEEAIKEFRARIMTFQQYLKNAIAVMEMQKKQVKLMATVRDKQDKAQADLLEGLMKYEDVGIAYYSDQDDSKRLLTHPNMSDLKERIDDSVQKWKNPYKDAYLWLKGEYLDIKGMYEAINGREQVMKSQLATQQKRKTDETELNKLSEGKTTFKSLLKSKSQKESNILALKANLEIADQEIADFKKLINFLTIYHGQIAIPKFKKAKAKLYLKALNNFCVKEISNAHLSATLYHSLLEKE